MSSTFLGVSWSFLNEIPNLGNDFQDYQMIIIFLVWIFSGSGFGLLMAYLVNYWLSQTGNQKIYDTIGKFILFFGILGYLILGILIYFNIFSFGLFIVLTAIIGMGSLGYYGLIFLSLVETTYPVPSLLIGTIIATVASVYSVLTNILIGYTGYNPLLIMVVVIFLPWVYLTITYETELKRYKYYLNQKLSKFQLFTVQQDIDQIKFKYL